MPPLMVSKNLEKNLLGINLVFFSLFAFFISLSTSIANIIAILLFVNSIFLISLKKKFKIILTDLPSLFFIAVFFILFLRTFHDFSYYEQNFRALMKYREFILFPFLALAFSALSPKHKKLIVNIFIFSTLIVIAVSFLASLNSLFFNKIGIFPFADYTIQTIAISIAIYFSVLFLLEGKKGNIYSIFYGLVIFLGFTNIFFIQSSRTGYICSFALIIILSYKMLSFKGLVIGGTVATFLVFSLFSTSDVFKIRLTQAIQEYKLQTIENQIQEEGKLTSTGLRLEFWHNSLSIIKQHPILGVGTGNFKTAYEKMAKKNGYRFQKSTDPHQEFLFLATTIGIPGAVLYLIALFLLIKRCNIWPRSTKPNYFLLGTTITLIITSLFNSPMWGSQLGNLFLFLLVVTYRFELGQKLSTNA